MKISRLFEIVYILIAKKNVTSEELAKHFEVSVRTIYRDINTLCEAGIPIYSKQGKNGGISIVESYILDKTLLSNKEQNEILIGLQSLGAIKYPEVENIVSKISTVFNKQDEKWIDIDFSNWGSSEEEKGIFSILKSSILDRKLIEFSYYNSKGEVEKRIVEPMQLIFKGRNWYLYGFCRNKSDYRIFKIYRMREIEILSESFERKDKNYKIENNNNYNETCISIKISKKIAYRVYDEFAPNQIEKQDENYFGNVNCNGPRACYDEGK
jgi:predicted DNA-binding transcriptional regulator YafY